MALSNASMNASRTGNAELLAAMTAMPVSHGKRSTVKPVFQTRMGNCLGAAMQQLQTLRFLLSNNFITYWFSIRRWSWAGERYPSTIQSPKSTRCFIGL
jgi:hypothetical protein